AVDCCIKEGDRVLLFQLKASKNKSYVLEGFISFMRFARVLQDELKGEIEICPWFLSFFLDDFGQSEALSQIKGWIPYFLTIGDKWKSLLGPKVNILRK
ncbi:MAG: hypothetical protein ACTSRZ_18890, partial [Promethearchaeota archaeon]